MSTAHREATAPPEERGLRRDEVRLLVASRHDGRITHAHAADLPDLLCPGDLVVVNTSATLPAALPATTAAGAAVEVHFATPSPHHDPDRWWVVELRTPSGAQPYADGCPADVLTLPHGAALELTARYASSARLWLARFSGPHSVTTHLRRHGRPIRYGYVPRPYPLEAYQTAFALHPGSAEMPSAARPLTARLTTRLCAGGIAVAPVTLHTGVSSPERHEPPYPERFDVPEATARLVNATKAWGGQVIAIGTTVVRALESTVANGVVGPGAGWTDRVVTCDDPPQVVDGLLTGWHEPEASHLDMLEAIAGRELLARSYDVAREHGYLWHEFGDSHLILP